MKKEIVLGLTMAIPLSVMAKQPNIIYIFTDQQNGQTMSCTGNSDLNTPAMDRLAREGVRFANAYVAAPLSTPSRSAMMTGVTPSVTETMVNGTPIKVPYCDNTLGKLLSAKGYRCAYGGKWHLPTSNIPDKTEGFEKVYNHNDYGLAEACGEYLSKHAKSDQPIFMVVSFDNPHNICEYVRDQNIFYADIAEPELKNCPNLPANFAIAPFDAHMIRAEHRANFKLYATTGYTIEDWRRYRNAYYRLTEAVDREIGKLLTYMDKNKMWDNTVVFFSSDHGDGNAAHQWNMKSALYEETTNIPFIVRLPGGANGGRVSEALVNNGLDLFATICDYASVKMPDYCLGKSLRPVLEGKATDVNEYVVTETLFDASTAMGWSVRGKDYKYTVYDKGRYREQLYDMRTDRGEMVNLAIEEKYRKTLDQYRKALVQWHETSGVKKDIRATPIIK